MSKKVRYAVVGAGWISQAWFMPGVDHTGNSELTAVVTGDPKKAEALKKKYKLQAAYTYAQFDDMLASGLVDALYIATPNFDHTDYTVRALHAGIHVLLEKPAAIGEADVEKMAAAQKVRDAKLMIAYRLHFEPGTIEANRIARSGELGEIVSFSSVFSQKIDPSNHRAKYGYEAGPVYDMGPYPINQVRNLFQAEPLEVFAVGSRIAQLGDFDDTVAVTLKFPRGRLAQFTVSYALAAVEQYTLSGTNGHLTSSPAYGFVKPIAHVLEIGTKQTSKTYKHTDHFGGETQYFSDCILHDRPVEPDGEEGLLDVRVIEAVRRSLASGQPVSLPPRARSRYLQLDQTIELSFVKPASMTDAEEPARK